MKLRFGSRESAPSNPVPGRSDPVLLSIPGGERIPGRVVERSDAALQVAVMVPTKPFSKRELAGLIVEYNTVRGRAQLRGTASVPNAGEPDLIELLAPLKVDVLQEREFVRVSSARPVLLFIGRGRERMQTFTVDLSGGGLLLAGPDTLRIGDVVEFRLMIAQDAQPITGTGTIVRVDMKGRRGMAFRKISEFDRRRLVRFIFELQRSERRRGVKSEDGYGS